MKMMQAQFSNWGLIQWKTLTWAEYKQFEESTNTKSPMAVANDIYRACIITGPNVIDATAGIVEFVVKHVYQQSAFSGTFEVLDKKLNNTRQQLNDNFLLSARAIIAGIFGYKFEEMDAWDEETFLLRLAQAEFVAGKPLMMGKDELPQENKTQPIPINKPNKAREITPAQKLVIDRVHGK